MSVLARDVARYLLAPSRTWPWWVAVTLGALVAVMHRVPIVVIVVSGALTAFYLCWATWRIARRQLSAMMPPGTLVGVGVEESGMGVWLSQVACFYSAQQVRRVVRTSRSVLVGMKHSRGAVALPRELLDDAMLASIDGWVRSGRAGSPHRRRRRSDR